MSGAGDHSELDLSGYEDQARPDSATRDDRRVDDHLLMGLALDQVPAEVVEDAKSVFTHRADVRKVAG